MQYDLLALDLDGTLLEADHSAAPATIDALAAAQRAGLAICLATGRSYIETIGVWRSLRLAGPYRPMVLLGGALVSEPDTGRSLWQIPIDRALACQFADALNSAGLAAMAIVDSWRHGLDYVMTTVGDQHAASRDWLSKMNVTVRRVPRLADAADMPQPLRVSAVIDASAAPALTADLQARFDGRLNIHAIVAPNYGVTIVECFAAGADKFAGVQYVAQTHLTPPKRIVAVGDDVNDLPMIRRAGLGVAMPQAPQAVQDAADHVASGGLAGFIHQLLAGRFD